MQAVTDNTAQPNPCTNFQSPAQPIEQCSMTPVVKDLMSECAHTVGQFKPQQPNAPYGNTYNPNWRNHPNLAWRPNPPSYVPPGAKPQFGSPSQSQQPPSSSPVEQVVLNLSKVVGNFVDEQKGTNVQLAQRIDTVENTLNKKFDDLQYSITNINKLLEGQERGRFPSQTLPNPKGIHEVGSGMDEVKSIITLRSGKEVDQPLPKPVEESRQGEKMQPEHILLEEDTMKYRIPPPFPQALRGKKKETQQAGMLEVLRQVKVNIPLLDLINQVPAYAKFLKDLCTIKRGLGIEKKAFLTEHVSALIQSKYPSKYKDPGSPTIPVNIGGSCINKALLDLGASVNFMPHSVYKQLGLGELKPTTITLSLADRSVKIPKGIVEDVLVKIDKFYYPVDFVVLDTAPSSNESDYVPIILGRPFMATANAIINCRIGIMQLTFGDMILELNIFHLNDNPELLEPENPITDEVVSVDQCAGTKGAQEMQGVISLGNEGELVLPTTPIASQLLESTTIPEEQRVVTVQTNQETETVESSLNKELDGFQSESDQKLDIQQESILKLTNQFVHQEEENLEEESEEEEYLTETFLGEQVQLQPQEELEVESLEAPEELQDTPVNFWPWTNEEQIRALITEESCEHETVEGTQEPIIDLDTTTTAQETKCPLPVAPSDDQVYILPTLETKSKPAAPAPKGKSNPLPASPPDSVFILPMPAAQPKPQASTTKATPLLVLQNIRRLVASVHALATTSKTMATAYIAWHSGWFGCGFGFGTPGPRHF